jgi:sn1-specific diacylglycerol lipase
LSEAPHHGNANTRPPQQLKSLPSYEVHGGMLKLAEAMGSPGKPVHKAVKKALSENEGYGKLFAEKSTIGG